MSQSSSSPAAAGVGFELRFVASGRELRRPEIGGYLGFWPAGGLLDPAGSDPIRNNP